jgi:ClpP class serine protease
MKRLAKYTPTGLLAVDPKAWGLEFLIDTGDAPAAFSEEGDAAVVHIRGPLVHDGGYIWTSYSEILDNARAAFASSQSRVILKIKSPGGDVAGCFETAREIRKLAEASGKECIAFADGQMCSAAYALACAAGRIVGGETSAVGSVGVIEGTVDVTQQDALMGMRFAFATSGARKGDGNPHMPLTKDAFGAMQANVDQLAGLFFALVQELRGVPAEAIASLQAGIFFGDRAIAAKLLDATMTWAELIAGGTPAAKSSGENKMSFAETIAGLTKIAEGDDKPAADKARKAIKMLLAEDKDGDGDEGGEDKKDAPPPKKAEDEKEAKAEDEKEEAKAEDNKESDAKMKAASPLAQVVALARKVHSLEAKVSAKEDAEARAVAFASRPDISDDVRKVLAAVATKDLAAVLATFPKAPHPAAASQAAGTAGATQGKGGDSAVPATERDFIDFRMGLTNPAAFVGTKDNELILGLLTPEEAKDRLAKMNGGK